MTRRGSFSHTFILTFPFSIVLILGGCGGGGSSSGGGGSTNNPPPSAANQWTWMRGNDADISVPPGWPGPDSEPYNFNPSYGTQGVPTAYDGKGNGTIPGGRNSSAFWKDKSGNFWLFGGDGVDIASYPGSIPGSVNEDLLNDLWEYSPATNEWTWVQGSKSSGPYRVNIATEDFGYSGVYGTQGAPVAGNLPGGRINSVSWVDSAGNFWLFGGLGLDSVGASGSLNDLWEFNPGTKLWTWIGGSNLVGQVGNYGTKGVPAGTNVPPSLQVAAGWIDGSDNLWLYGGRGQYLDGTTGALGNLWEFNPVSKVWTWVTGSGGSANLQSPVYGTLDVPAPGNTPGGRSQVTSWIDGSGNFWLFGGACSIGCDQTGWSSDLWEFSPASKEWTWMGSSGGSQDSGVYGSLGVAAAGNFPGGRYGAAGWADSAGNLWLFGGTGFGAGGLMNTGWLNDLWKFNLATKQWSWMGGTQTGNSGGTYGVEGTAAAANIPGGRYNSSYWVDNSGNFWIFAGEGTINGVAGGSTALNDLWRYQP